MTNKKELTGVDYLRMPLKSYLALGNKENLVNISQMFGIEISPLKPKAEYVDEISAYILSHPKEFLNKLTCGELYMLEIMCKDDDKNFIEWSIQMPQQSLYEMSMMFIYMCSDVDGSGFFIIPYDLKEAIKNLITPMIQEKEKSKDRELENIIFGFLNIYGIINLELLEEFVSKTSGVSKDAVDAYINRHFLLKSHVYGSKWVKPSITSPFVYEDEYHDIMVEIQKHKNLDYKQDIPVEELSQWGTMPFPPGKTAIAQPVLQLMSGKYKNSGFCQADLTAYWASAQRSLAPHSTLVNFTVAMRYQDKVDVKGIHNIFGNFVNNMPRWLLKGHSYNEIES